MSEREIPNLLRKFVTGGASRNETILVFRFLFLGVLTESQRLNVCRRIVEQRNEFLERPEKKRSRWREDLLNTLLKAGADDDTIIEVNFSLGIGLEAEKLVSTLNSILSHNHQDVNFSTLPFLKRFLLLLSLFMSNQRFQFATVGGLGGITTVVFYFYFGPLQQVKITLPHAHEVVCPGSSNTLDVYGPSYIKFSDGTQAILSKDASISHGTQDENGRGICINNGNVTLHVASNPKVPFVVRAIGVEIIVIGTGLNIKVNGLEKTVETSLVHGQAHVLFNGNKTQLIPGQQLTVLVAAGTIMKVREIDRSQIDWPYPYIEFNGVRIEDAASVLEQHYHISVDVDPRVRDTTITGTFKNEQGDLDNILYSICLSSSLRFERSGNHVIILPVNSQNNGSSTGAKVNPGKKKKRK